MKISIKILFVFICLSFITAKTNAQYILKEADKQFEMFNFSKAVVLYTEAYQQKKTLRATERIAECYRLIRDYKQAESWFAILVTTEGAKPEAYRYYAEMLRANSKFAEAKIAFARYAVLARNLSIQELQQVELWQLSCDSAIAWMKKPKPVKLSNESILNTPQADFGVVSYNKSLIFTSDRVQVNDDAKPFLKFDTRLPNKKTYGWTGNAYLKLYQKDEKNNISLFALNPGFDYHLASPAFNPDGSEMFFTTTRIPERLVRESKEPATVNVQIYSAKKVNGIWSEPVAFRYNKPFKWSVSDPHISSDGNTLYFASNMPGGKGGSDIYFCKRNENGGWGDAVNFESINTPGDERNLVEDDKYFYFASNGHVGMGGLDIYRVRKTYKGLGKVENLGYPINSSQDDFALSLTPTQKRYLASNREGGLGNDDIYSYTDVEKTQVAYVGKLLNRETNTPLANAVLSLSKLGPRGQKENTIKVLTDENGIYEVDLEEDADYLVTATKTNFRSGTDKISTKGLKGIQQQPSLSLRLDSIEINKAIVLENIYYDFNKAGIRSDAALELDKLVTMMKENPTLWVELSSHTDKQGTDKYNLWLSEMRAISAVRYIVRNGIDKSRITAKGYGSTKPIVDCQRCTVADNKLNRRTEFKIVKQ